MLKILCVINAKSISWHLVESFTERERVEKVCHPTLKEAKCLGLHGPGPGFLSEQVTHPEAVDLRHTVARHQAV